jgi:DNA/RNA-binding domain of Phe-tRNA-synthetase-like protein
LLKSKNELQEQRKKSMELEASALESMKALQREFSDKKDAQGPKELVIRDDIGIAELTLQMSRYLNGKISDVTNSHTTIFTKIATGLAKMADKINPDSVNAAERKKTDLGAITSKKAEEKKAAEDAAERERERKKNDAIEIANAKKGGKS